MGYRLLSQLDDFSVSRVIGSVSPLDTPSGGWIPARNEVYLHTCSNLDHNVSLSLIIQNLYFALILHCISLGSYFFHLNVLPVIVNVFQNYITCG